jgi:hypothetical protein
MVAWLLLAAMAAFVGSLALARAARARKLSEATIADPERLGEELLDYVARQGPRIVDLGPFWHTHECSEADRWAIQGPLLQSGRLVPAAEVTVLGRVRAYLLAPLPEYVVLAK